MVSIKLRRIRRCPISAAAQVVVAILLSLEVVGAVVVKGAVAQGGQRLSKWRTIDIGPQLPGQVLVRRVVVANTGSDTIRFFKVITSCGCLKGDFRPAVIAAGKTATLRVRIVTRLWPGPEWRMLSMSIWRYWVCRTVTTSTVQPPAAVTTIWRPFYRRLGLWWSARRSKGRPQKRSLAD